MVDLDLDTFESNGPVLSLSEAKRSAGTAIIEVLDLQSENPSLSERAKREIFLKYGLWMPSKAHWRMDAVPHYRSLERNGELSALTLDPK